MTWFKINDKSSRICVNLIEYLKFYYGILEPQKHNSDVLHWKKQLICLNSNSSLEVRDKSSSWNLQNVDGLVVDAVFGLTVCSAQFQVIEKINKDLSSA